MSHKESISPAYWEIKERVIQNIENILKMNKFSIDKTVWLVTPSVFTLVPKNSCGEVVQISSETQQRVREVEKARHYLYKEPSSVVVSFGGGRVIDIGKLLAKETSRSSISVPSILSSDAIASPISVMDYDDKRVRVSALPPKVVIVDLDIIKNAPHVYNLAGVGDLISNLSAVNDWVIAEQKGIEHVNPLAKFLAYNPALKLSKFNGRLYENEFLSILAEGLILSGVSMTVDGTSRPASGSEHNISHALDKILGTNRKLHGIQVGFATLLTLYLQGQDKLMRHIKEFYKKIGFPVTFSELGISKETFLKAVQLAPSIRDRYTILNEVSEEKIIKAIEEVYGR
jgi:glycerol-1-phosphate dehydrogenase [NAD(P)+]